MYRKDKVAIAVYNYEQNYDGESSKLESENKSEECKETSVHGSKTNVVDSVKPDKRTMNLIDPTQFDGFNLYITKPDPKKNNRTNAFELIDPAIKYLPPKEFKITSINQAHDLFRISDINVNSPTEQFTEEEFNKRNLNALELNSLKTRSDYVESSPIISTSLDVYKYQVGGHGLKNSNYRILADGNGGLYKPVQHFPRGEIEIIFYQKIFNQNTNDPVLVELRKFIPRFLGLFSYNDPLKDNLYIGIEDLLFQFNLPSVADLKIGQRRYEADAPLAKKLRKVTKYKWRESVGFLFIGIRVSESTPILLDKLYGLKLDPEDIYHKGIKVFLGTNATKAKVIASKFISKLHGLLDWFKSQKEMAFIGASLLLAYESRTYKGVGNSEIDTSGLYVGHVQVKLIDFTHVFSVYDHDDNCIYGIESLIKYFKRVQLDNDY